jgi:hypothetical protein
MAMRQPGPPEVSRPCRRPWIQIPILLLMKVFYNGPKRGKIGHVKIGIGLRISGRTFTHTSDKKVRPAHQRVYYGCSSTSIAVCLCMAGGGAAPRLRAGECKCDGVQQLMTPLPNGATEIQLPGQLIWSNGACSAPVVSSTWTASACVHRAMSR